MTIQIRAPSAQLTINANALEAYNGSAHTLIPLHRYDAVSTDAKGRARKDGKRPLDGDWTNRQYDQQAVLRRCRERNLNVGIRLNERQLVIDYDPRRDPGSSEWLGFCLDYGVEPQSFPTVRTGSGGLHLYARLPADVRVIDTLPHYKSVEFKSRGRQVVSAGSIHPDTRKHYLWADDHPPLSETPELPAALVEAIRRPERRGEAVPGGTYSNEKLAVALAALDATKFRQYDDWIRLGMACYHATNGDGRDDFIEWCITDPEYADHADRIGRHWDSFGTERSDAVTYRTLNKILSDNGAANCILAAEAADDFESVEEPSENAWLEGEYEAASEEEESWLTALNDDYCAVTTGGKYRIMYQARTQTGIVWETMNKTDFQSLHENRTVVNPRDPTKTIELGKAWQQWPGRRTAKGTSFDTTLPAGALDKDGNLNLWLGWAVASTPGDWKRFRAMIRDDVCAGEERAFDYFIKWLAWTFQHPGELPQVALAMRGEKGTGKGTLGEAVARCYGSHAMCTSQMDHIGGHFNGHMEFNLFTYADEAFWAGDPRQEATIKKLITDERIMYEHKGVTAYPGVNRTSLMFGSNDEWIVPATEGERRYCVVRTSDRHKCPEGEPGHPNRPYWDAIHAELRNGGLAAFLHDMLHLKLPAGWHPRGHVPLTQELANQKARGLKGVVGFYFNALQTGRIEETVEGTNGDWEAGPLKVKPTEFWEYCRSWIRSVNPRAEISRRSMSADLTRFGWQVGEHLRHGKARDRYWLCPPLDEARAAFEAVMKGRMFDDDPAD